MNSPEDKIIDTNLEEFFDNLDHESVPDNQPGIIDDHDDGVGFFGSASKKIKSTQAKKSVAPVFDQDDDFTSNQSPVSQELKGIRHSVGEKKRGRPPKQIRKSVAVKRN
mmetsp:Transcript_37544/g.33616  ORF Transcript_37544/g.33616 Transcript_37544/m.33616 type:complete len:109 (-) Transcript_37544:648-974(-)